MSVKLDALGIVVHDLGESLRFYRTLGLEIPSWTCRSRTWNSRCRTVCV